MNKMAQAQRFMEAIPHAKALGIRFESIGEGEAEMQMDYNENFIGDPQTRVIHGGAVFALLDSCCGAAVLSHPDQRGLTATIDLRVDYMRPAMPQQECTLRLHLEEARVSYAFWYQRNRFSMKFQPNNNVCQ